MAHIKEKTVRLPQKTVVFSTIEKHLENLLILQLLSKINS